jgi:hypothetical protein
MKFEQIIKEQDTQDPIDQDPRIIQAENEIKNLEINLQKKKQQLYQLKARVAQQMSQQQARTARTTGEVSPEQKQ